MNSFDDLTYIIPAIYTKIDIEYIRLKLYSIKLNFIQPEVNKSFYQKQIEYANSKLETFDDFCKENNLTKSFGLVKYKLFHKMHSVCFDNKSLFTQETSNSIMLKITDDKLTLIDLVYHWIKLQNNHYSNALHLYNSPIDYSNNIYHTIEKHTKEFDFFFDKLADHKLTKEIKLPILIEIARVLTNSINSSQDSDNLLISYIASKIKIYDSHPLEMLNSFCKKSDVQIFELIDNLLNESIYIFKSFFNSDLTILTARLKIELNESIIINLLKITNSQENTDCSKDQKDLDCVINKFFQKNDYYNGIIQNELLTIDRQYYESNRNEQELLGDENFDFLQATLSF